MNNIKTLFFKYVSQNILGMIGVSCYVLADTFFISQAVGPDGVTALNLVLPLYNFIFGLGQMIGVGGAIRFAIEKGEDEKAGKVWFSNSIICAGIISIIFVLIGLFFAGNLVSLLGGDETIVAIGKPYTQIFMCFTPFFMWNYICNAFVRNDGSPSIAMAATLFSSLFNIVFDYILMYPFGLGMVGAALATAVSPIVGILIALIHFRKEGCSISFSWVKPDFKRLLRGCQVGVSAFVGEMSSGVTTVVFNYLILMLAGNTGVAAYGIVANLALVMTAMFNGIAQGCQPILSGCYGLGDRKGIKETLRMGVILSGIFAVIIMAIMWSFARPIAGVFISTANDTLEAYAIEGLHIYMTGFVFAGWNILASMAFSALGRAREAGTISILRGFVMIILCAVAFSFLLGMRGVWLAFPIAEGLTFIVTNILRYRSQRAGNV